jgi:ribosomal protein S18 acetylase RimI-like enzyme
MSVRLVPAADVPHADRASLWNEAFSDYFTPSSFTAESLAGFERAFDLDPTGSRIALEDDRPVAFAMLGVRERSGWVGGMGVIPSARRRGHGRRVMNGLLDAARERSLTALRLEVLVQNQPAVPLYQGLGYRTVRLLEVWDRAADAAAPAAAGPAREMPIERARRFLEAARAERAPWQRELGPALAAFPDLQALASADDRVVAIFRAAPERIGLLDLAAAPGTAPESRESGFDAVLATLFTNHPGRLMRLLNLPEGDPAGPALARAGAAVSHRQWEMERAVQAR